MAPCVTKKFCGKGEMLSLKALQDVGSRIRHSVKSVDEKVLPPPSRSAAEGCVSGCEESFPGVGARVAYPDAPRREPHFSGDFQQAQANGFDLCGGPFRSCQSQSPQGMQEHVGE